MAAAVATSTPAPTGRPRCKQANAPSRSASSNEIGLTQQIDVVHQHDDGKRGENHDQRVTPSPGFDRQVDRKCDRGQPGRRIHEHERQQRPGAAEHAHPGKHRRRGGRIHERKETTALGPGVDIKPLSYSQAHLVPEAVILGRETQDQVGDRKRREDQHRTAQGEPPGALDPSPALPIARPWPQA